MPHRQRVGLALAVWGLRLAALATLIPWFIRTHQYEATATRERTYFALGWPEQNHWLASEVVVEAPPFTIDSNGRTVPNTLRRRGPLTAWDPETTCLGPEDEHRYRRWKRENPLYGPLLPTAVGVVLWVVAVYLNQFRRRPAVRDNPADSLGTEVSASVPLPVTAPGNGQGRPPG